MRKALSITFTALLCVCVAQAQQLTPSQKALRGLRGVVPKVAIERDGSPLGRLLTESSLQAGAELHLRKSGINVGTQADMRQTPMPPSLFISVMGMECETQIIYAVTLSLFEIGAVERSPASAIFVTSWTATRIGSMTPTDARLVKETISDLLDKFINDWMAANPR